MDKLIESICKGSEMELVEELFSLDHWINPSEEQDFVRNMVARQDAKDPCRAYRVDDVPFPEGVEDYFDSLRSTFNMPSYSPHRSFPMAELYVRDDDNPMLNLLDQLLHPRFFARQGSALFVGNRGSGKSCTMDYWLASNNDALDAQKIVWVRCDLEKLYGLWEQNQALKSASDIQFVTIEEYFLIQLVYKLCKHCGRCGDGTQGYPESSIFKSIWTTLEAHSVNCEYLTDARRTTSTQRRLISVLQEFQADICAHEAQNAAREGYRYARDAVMNASMLPRNQRQRSKRNWVAAGNALLSFLTQEGQDYRFLLMIDGSDNIVRQPERNTGLYAMQLRQMAELLWKRKFRNFFVTASVRPRTLRELKQEARGFEHGVSQLKPAEMPIKVPQLPAIVDRRLDHIAQPEDRVLREIIERVKITPALQSKDHHDNVRELVFNMLSLVKMLYFRHQQLRTMGASLNLSRDFESWVKRNLVLNGAFFLRGEPTVEGATSVGDYCYSLFHVLPGDIEKERNIWPGFCGLRLMQVLDLHTRLPCDRLEHSFVKVLGYPREYVRRSLGLLLRHGLVDSVDNPDRGSAWEYHIELSTKGGEVLELLDQSPDVVYYLSMNSAIPKRLYERYEAHSNRLDIRSNYAYCLLNNLFYFQGFADRVHRQEKMRIESFGGSEKELFEGLDVPFGQHRDYEDRLRYLVRTVRSEQARENLLMMCELEPTDVACWQA